MSKGIVPETYTMPLLIRYLWKAVCQNIEF